MLFALGLHFIGQPRGSLPHFSVLLTAVSQWYGTYLAHSTYSVLTERMSLTISLLYHTAVLNSTGDSHRDKQTCPNADSRSPTGRQDQAPDLPSHLSLAPSAALPIPSRPHLLAMALKKKKKRNLCGEFPLGLPSCNYPICTHAFHLVSVK